MKSNRIQSKRSQRGQGMTEYLIIVALIAVAGIGTYRFFGATIRNQTAGLAQQVAGSANTGTTAAATAATQAASAATVNKQMNNYSTNN